MVVGDAEGGLRVYYHSRIAFCERELKVCICLAKREGGNPLGILEVVSVSSTNCYRR